jgi:hypothetical protein
VINEKQAQQTWATLDWGDEVHPAASFLSLPDPASLGEEEQASFSYVVERDKRKFEATPTVRDRFEYRVAPLFTGLLQSPVLAELWARFGDFFMTAQSRGSFSDRDRQLADQAIVTLVGKSSWTQAGYIRGAVNEGIPIQHVKAIRDGRVEALEPADRELVEIVQATVRGELTVELFETLKARMGVKAAIEYIEYGIYKCGLCMTLAAMWQIQGIEPDSKYAEELLQAELDGTRESTFMEAGWMSASREERAK